MFESQPGPFTPIGFSETARLRLTQPDPSLSQAEIYKKAYNNCDCLRTKVNDNIYYLKNSSSDGVFGQGIGPYAMYQGHKCQPNSYGSCGCEDLKQAQSKHPVHLEPPSYLGMNGSLIQGSLIQENFEDPSVKDPSNVAAEFSPPPLPQSSNKDIEQELTRQPKMMRPQNGPRVEEKPTIVIKDPPMQVQVEEVSSPTEESAREERRRSKRGSKRGSRRSRKRRGMRGTRGTRGFEEDEEDEYYDDYYYGYDYPYYQQLPIWQDYLFSRNTGLPAGSLYNGSLYDLGDVPPVMVDSRNVSAPVDMAVDTTVDTTVNTTVNDNSNIENNYAIIVAMGIIIMFLVIMLLYRQ